MNKEDLTKIGIEDEAVIKKIIVLHGKDIEAKKVDIEARDKQLEAGAGKLEKVQGQLEKANKQVQSLKDMDPEAAKKAAADWEATAKEHEAALKTAQEDSDKAIAGMQFDHKLEAALSEAGVKDPRDVIHLLNRDTISLGDDNKFVGLKEQLEPLQESKDYLFSSADDKVKIVKGGHSSSVIKDSVLEAARDAAGLIIQKD